MGHRSSALLIVLLSLTATAATPQPSSQPAVEAIAATPLTADALTELVAPIALYPDDLLGIVLPASTYPLQVVQAARFLEALKSDSTLQPDPSWDDSIVALLNYPEVVALLDKDIDWTWRLGEAVINQNDDVIAAVADFREQASLAGNLRSDDRQIVSNDGGAIEIRPANPEVMYVPYYEPAQVIVYQPAPVYYYYPRPYPVYYYPYPVGYDFYSPYFWGVTSIFSIAWASHHVHVCHIYHHHHRYYGHPYHHDHYYYRYDRHRYGHYDGGYAAWGSHDGRGGYDDDVWRPDRRYRGDRPRGDRPRSDDRRYAMPDRNPITRGERDRDGARGDRVPGQRTASRFRDDNDVDRARTSRTSADTSANRGSDHRRAGPRDVAAGRRIAESRQIGYSGFTADQDRARTVRRWQGAGPRTNALAQPARTVAKSPRVVVGPQSKWNPRSVDGDRGAISPAQSRRVWNGRQSVPSASAPALTAAAPTSRVQRAPGHAPQTASAPRTVVAPGRDALRPPASRMQPRMAARATPAPRAYAPTPPVRQAPPRAEARQQTAPRERSRIERPEGGERQAPARTEPNSRGHQRGGGRSDGRWANR